MQWAQVYLGQRGLATQQLMEEIDSAIDALSPGSKMIIVAAFRPAA